MKKLLCLFMSIVLLFSSTISVSAAVVTGTSYAVQWSFDDDTGVLTFSGTGRMDDYFDYHVFNHHWPFENMNVKRVVIEEGVKNIGVSAFAECRNLEVVILPRSVKDIKYDAFLNCTNLKAILILGDFGYNNISLDSFVGCNLGNLVIYCEEGSDAHEFAIDNNLKFEIVTVNADGSINNFPDFVNTTFNVAHKDKSKEFSCYYSDLFFNKDATEYNHELATMSLCLALSTFQSEEKNISFQNAQNLLDKCGFDCFESFESYELNTSTDGIGYLISHKKIGEETLIAVAVRSGGYSKEWASNFTLGGWGDHVGFDKASDKVLEGIDKYIEKYGISNNVKFWVAGYSRGAATATQTAAKLNQVSKFLYDSFEEVRHLEENVSFTNNDVYAYGFATPAGAIAANNPTNSALYGNIFNILNFNDIVPRVAPEKWEFGRYGITYYLPFYENSFLMTKTKELEVKEWFLNNGLLYSVDKYVPLYTETPSLSGKLSNDSIGVFQNKLVNDITKYMRSRGHYCTNYQKDICDVVSDGLFELKDLLLEISGFLALESLSMSLYIPTALLNAPLLAEAHSDFGAYYLGWMENIPASDALKYLNDGKIRYWIYNCPVDVYVYDKSGKLVAAIENDMPVEIEDAPFSYGVDENGQKYFYIPIDAEYDIKVIAREDCETTCTVNELSGGSFDESRVVTYTEIPMVEDEELSVSTGAYSEDDIINGTEEGSSAEYTIQKETGEVLEPNVDVAGEEIENYTYNVTVEYDENKGIVYGGGEFTIGQFCQVTAENKPGYKFSKWTVNGETVSTEPTYRFAVKENVTIVAEYEVCEHPTWSAEAVAVTCTEDGYTKHTCDVCTYSYNDNIVESTGHNYQWCETVTPTTSQSGLKQYICLVCENVGRSEMLPILSGFNFVATDVSSYSLVSYNGTVTEVKIPANHNNCVVTSVGSSCFKGNENITRVEIPVGITTIGYLAFYGCTALDTVSIPATVTSIGAQAFYGFKGTIICQKDSYAHQYALENGIDYIIPTLKATDSKSFVDFENQFVFSTITKCKNIDDIIVGPPTMLTLPTASLKSNGGDFYGTGSTITMFDGNAFMGDYVLVINGDINGDSACDALDAAQVALVSNGQKTIDGAYAMAADNNHDDEISIEDYQAIVNKVIA